MNDPGYQAEQPSDRKRARRAAEPDEEIDDVLPVRRRRLTEEDDEDEPEAYESFIPYKNPKGLLAYYAGVFSLIPGLGALLGPAALILGIAGVRYANRFPLARGKGHAISGIVMGSITSLLNWGAIVFVVGAILFSK